METATKITTPEIGMSATYFIGSDAYHEIIVDITRNGKSVLTLSADRVLGGVSLADWNSVPQSVRAIRARDTWIELIAGIVDNADDESDAMWTTDRIRNSGTYTLRKSGEFFKKGTNYGWLKLNSQYSYLDPSF
jgi:hypothetical protein